MYLTQTALLNFAGERYCSNHDVNFAVDYLPRDQQNSSGHVDIGISTVIR
jgi:hypothetical protein